MRCDEMRCDAIHLSHLSMSWCLTVLLATVVGSSPHRRSSPGRVPHRVDVDSHCVQPQPPPPLTSPVHSSCPVAIARVDARRRHRLTHVDRPYTTNVRAQRIRVGMSKRANAESADAARAKQLKAAGYAQGSVSTVDVAAAASMSDVSPPSSITSVIRLPAAADSAVQHGQTDCDGTQLHIHRRCIVLDAHSNIGTCRHTIRSRILISIESHRRRQCDDTADTLQSGCATHLHIPRLE
jgi:hypothetical protein